MDVLLWGATGQAKVLRECLSQAGHVVVALVDSDPSVPPPWPGAVVLNGISGFEAWCESRHELPSFLVAVGGDRGRERLALHGALVAAGLRSLSVQHPTAFVAGDAVLGEGCQVLAMSAVAVQAVLGRSCIVNTGAVVEHECRLGEGVHVGPGARLAGAVSVGDCSFIGAGAVVLPHVDIGRDATVGAGAVVLVDVPAGATVAGNPARLLMSRP